jgi:cullin 3
MFQHSKLDELGLMFRIFKRVESTLKFIIQKMSPYIEERGKKIVEDEALLKDPIEFTKKLLELKSEMDKMVESSFSNDIRFQKNRDNSFQNFMNQCQFTPHYIASYCDNELKKGLKGLNESETDQRLEAIIRLFCCLHGRDIFIKAYTKFLASRLLNKSFLSQDAEELMLQKLKVECGHNTVNKISQMFIDITLSKDLMATFKQKNPNGIVNGVEFSTEILTNGHWPEQNTGACTLPPEMKQCTSKFEEFYKHKYSNRNLTWLFQHGQVELQPTFTQKKYIFVVNCYQAVVLCLFNKHNTLTYDEVKNHSAIPEGELNNALLYLCNPKQKILDKENMKKPQFAPTEKVNVNTAFTNNNIRVQFVPTQTHKKKTAEKNDSEKVDDKEIRIERQNIIDAVIVRIMKARKTDKHNQLMEDVIRQISIFMAQPQMIKQRIESLIEREYLKRDESDRSKYIYLP